MRCALAPTPPPHCSMHTGNVAQHTRAASVNQTARRTTVAGARSHRSARAVTKSESLFTWVMCWSARVTCARTRSNSAAWSRSSFAIASLHFRFVCEAPHRSTRGAPVSSRSVCGSRGEQTRSGASRPDSQRRCPHERAPRSRHALGTLVVRGSAPRSVPTQRRNRRPATRPVVNVVLSGRAMRRVCGCTA